MILDAILSAFVAVVDFLLGGIWAAIPVPPDWFVAAIADLDTVMDYVYLFDNWIPVNLALTCGAAVMGAYVFHITIQITRTVISYFTFGGGAT